MGYIFLLVIFFSASSYDSNTVITRELSEFQASLKVEYTSRFPHFINYMLSEHKNGENNKVFFDRTHEVYSLNFDDRSFVSRAVAINYKDKIVLWAGQYTQEFKNYVWQDAYPKINLMLGYLRTKGFIEMRPALISNEIRGFKLAPNYQHLILFFTKDNQMFLRSIEMQNSDWFERVLETPAVSFDISYSSASVFCADTQGFLARYNVHNLRHESWELSYQLNRVCCGYDDTELVGISESGAHYIQFVKARRGSKLVDKPRIIATIPGKYINIWRGTAIDSYILQDSDGLYHEISLKRQKSRQSNENT